MGMAMMMINDVSISNLRIGLWLLLDYFLHRIWRDIVVTSQPEIQYKDEVPLFRITYNFGQLESSASNPYSE